MGGTANLTAAIALYERVIVVETAAYGVDHAEVALTLNNKANTLQRMGGTANLTAAIALYDRVIAIRTATFGSSANRVESSI